MWRKIDAITLIAATAEINTEPILDWTRVTISLG